MRRLRTGSNTVTALVAASGALVRCMSYRLSMTDHSPRVEVSHGDVSGVTTDEPSLGSPPRSRVHRRFRRIVTVVLAVLLAIAAVVWRQIIGPGLPPLPGISRAEVDAAELSGTISGGYLFSVTDNADPVAQRAWQRLALDRGPLPWQRLTWAKMYWTATMNRPIPASCASVLVVLHPIAWQVSAYEPAFSWGASGALVAALRDRAPEAMETDERQSERQVAGSVFTSTDPHAPQEITVLWEVTAASGATIKVGAGVPCASRLVAFGWLPDQGPAT
ncbi:MAG TPA: hypothetical protein VF163_00560 [Micromonosporaceae bacterium]